MIKTFSALAVFILISMFQVNAQNSTSKSSTATNPGGFYIKGGVNLSNISTQSDGSYNKANTLTTFNVGVVDDIPLADVLSLQAGVVLTGKGAEAHSSILNTTNKFNPLYVEVPVNLVVKLPLGGDNRIFFGAGPYGALGIGGKSKTTSSVGDASHNLNFGDSNSDDLKTFDFGLNGLAGVEINRLMLGVNYGLGLSKIYPNQDNGTNDKNKYRVFSINVGVRI